MAFPDEPLGTPVPTGEPSPIFHDSDHAATHPDEAVTGEVLTDPSHAQYAERQSYSDSWSSSYGQTAGVTLTPPVSETSAPTRSAPPPAGGGGRPPNPPDPPDEEEDEEDGMARMSFLDHLGELRKCIIRALMGMGIAFGACLCLGPQLWNVIRQPAKHALDNLHAIDPTVNPNMLLIDPMDGFQIIWMKIPLLCAIFVSSPWVLYQVWAFISPGLYKREKRWAVPFVLSSSLLFILGGFFAYFVAFRYGLEFLLGMGLGQGITPGLDLNKYYDLFVDVMLGVGIIFEIPVMLFLLTLIRVASPAFLVRHSRYAILIIVILAAVITPTGDVFNLSLFATPMILLFYIGIFASWLLVLHREKQRFPWGIFLKWLGIVLIALAVVLTLAGWYYKIHFVNHWPFLTR